MRDDLTVDFEADFLSGDAEAASAIYDRLMIENNKNERRCENDNKNN